MYEKVRGGRGRGEEGGRGGGEGKGGEGRGEVGESGGGKTEQKKKVSAFVISIIMNLIGVQLDILIFWSAILE